VNGRLVPRAWGRVGVCATTADRTGGMGMGHLLTETGRLSRRHPESTGSAGSSQRDAEDVCARRIEDAELEEVERCAFFEGHGALPPVGTDVVVVREQNSGRPAAATISAREIIGLLPADYNYLVACLESGYSYAGVVTLAPQATQQSSRSRSRPSMPEGMLGLVGQAFVDVALPGPTVRLGGVVHAARGLAAVGVPFHCVYFAPAYLADLVDDYVAKLGGTATWSGDVVGSPNVLLVMKPQEAGDQEYVPLLRSSKQMRVDPDTVARQVRERASVKCWPSQTPSMQSHCSTPSFHWAYRSQRTEMYRARRCATWRAKATVFRASCCRPRRPTSHATMAPRHLVWQTKWCLTLLTLCCSRRTGAAVVSSPRTA